MDRDRVRITGIPIHPVFRNAQERGGVPVAARLDPERPTVLLLAGGFGVGPIEGIYRAMLAIERPLQVVAVAARTRR